MTDDDKDEQSDKGFEIATPIGAKASVSRQAFAMLLPYVGPHIKWLMFAGAIWLLVWAFSEGFVKVWTASKLPQQQLTD